MQTIYNKKNPQESFSSLISTIKLQKKVKRVLIIRGRHSFETSGAKELLKPLVENTSLEVKEWADFTSNPKREEVNVGVELKNVYSPELIIAVGGGSVIDMAKLVRFYSADTATPLLAIPTTSGTGAESTKFAVCYVNGVKTSVCDDAILPDYVFLDSSLTLKNSDYLTACTGFDALAQAIEAYWNINATIESDQIALKAIKLLFDNLKNVGKINEENRREELMVGANLAGQAINITRTTAPHAMSYTFTSKFGYPHGHAVALTFPAFFELNVNCSRENYLGNDYDTYHAKMLTLLDIMGISQDLDIKTFLYAYIKKLGLSFDSQRPFDNEVVVNGINLERAKNNPHILTKEIINQVVKSIK